MGPARKLARRCYRVSRTLNVHAIVCCQKSVINVQCISPVAAIMTDVPYMLA